MHLSISPHKPGKTWPYSKWHLKSRGNVKVVLGEVQFNQPGCHYTGPGYPTNHDLLTLLTVLATFVSRQLLNPNGHHTHTHTYILLPCHNLRTIPFWLLSQGSASHVRSNSSILELVFFISGFPGILLT